MQLPDYLQAPQAAPPGHPRQTQQADRIYPPDGRQPLEDAGLGGVTGGRGRFVQRAVYLCRGAACLNCGACLEGCPTKAIFHHHGCPVIDPCLCNDCGWCEGHCPAGAILRTVQLVPVP